MRTRLSATTYSERGLLGSVVATAVGVALLGYAYASHGCSQVACARDTGIAFQTVSVADWAIYWRESCNSCGTDLTPVLAGVALLAFGVFWLGAGAVGATSTVWFDSRR